MESKIQEETIGLLSNNSTEEDNLLFPTSPYVKTINQVGNGTDKKMTVFVERQKEINPKINYQLTECLIIDEQTTNNRSLWYSSDNYNFKVKYDNRLIPKGSNNAFEKLITLCLIKVGKIYDYKSETLKRNVISLNTHELVDLGCYTDISNAKRGLDKIVPSFGGIVLEIAPDNKTNIRGEHTLFVSRFNTGVTMELVVNPFAPWGAILNYWAIIPKWSFKLTSRAFSLIKLIFEIGRQRHDKITTVGTFKLSVRLIQQRLDLASEKDIYTDVLDENGNVIDKKLTVKATGDPKSIQRIIKSSMQEIEETAKQHNDTNISMKLVCNPKATTKQFVNDAYVEVSLTGTYAEKHNQLSDKKNNKILKNSKQVERAQLKAKIEIEKEKLRNQTKQEQTND